MANHIDIAQVLSVICEAFPNFKTTERTPEVYYQLLADIPGDELKAAALHCVSEQGRAFAPSIGEIRGAVAELRGMAGNVPGPFQAWQEVLAQFRETGSYGTPQFSHPLIAQAVRQMGWREMCLSENQIADRARFIQCYEQLMSRATKEDMLLPEVRGYIESNGARLMAPAESMRLLAGKLSGKK
jgi:hypothetical protein